MIFNINVSRGQFAPLLNFTVHLLYKTFLKIIPTVQILTNLHTGILYKLIQYIVEL